MLHYFIGHHLQHNYTADRASFHTTSATSIDLPILHLKAQEFYTNGLAASTKSNYFIGHHLQHNYTADRASFHTTSATSIDLPILHLKAQEFYTNGLAASTKSTYSAGQLRLTTFCKELKVLVLF